MSRSIRARVMGALSRRVGMRFFRILVSEDAANLAPGNSPARAIRETEALRICLDPAMDMRTEHVGSAFARGDACVAAYDGDAAVGYCWVAFAPVHHLDGVWVEVDERAGWIYKCFVRPSHRGRGLGTSLYRAANAARSSHGRERSVVSMESHNRPSIKAALRAGFRPAGYAAYSRYPRLRVWCSPAARRHALSFFLKGASQ